MKLVPVETKCDSAHVDNLVRKTPRLALLYTKPNCVWCDPYSEMVRETLSKKIKLRRIDLGVGEGECEAAADNLKVDDTPTLLYFRGGKLKKTIVPTGDEDTDREIIKGLK